MRISSWVVVFLLLHVAFMQTQPWARADVLPGDRLIRFDDSPSHRSPEWQKFIEEEENRHRETIAMMRKMVTQKMMMGLRFEKRDVPVVQIPPQRGLSVQFMCPFRNGVFIAGYHQERMRQRRILMEGYYFDPSDRKTHKIDVKEIEEVHAAVVAGERAWFAGLTNGKPILTGVGEKDRVTVPLPLAKEVPDLGLDGQSLLAVYSKMIYQLTDRQWKLVHSGDFLSPCHGVPPQRHGNKVFFLDIESSLLWLTPGEKSRLHFLVNDMGLFEPILWTGLYSLEMDFGQPANWNRTSSYCVTNNGDVWACIGNGSFLVRRSKGGDYAMAIANNSVQFREEPVQYGEADQGVCISAVTALPDNSLLLAGLTGLYRLRGDELVQEIAFAYEEKDSEGRYVRRWGYDLTNVLALDDGSYMVSSNSSGGAYLLDQDDDGQWNIQSLTMEDINN